MESGSNTKHMSIPMSVNLSEESTGSILKGQNPSTVANNNSSSAANSSLNTNSSVSQANLFRPADSQQAVGLQAAAEINSLHAKKNPNNNGTAISGSNNNINSSNNVANYGILSKNQSGVRYKECLKNHAANMGGYAVDGCGEFMPAGDEGSLEALKCAACGCHRNFHRREVNGSTATASNVSLLALPSPVSANNTSASINEYGEGDHPHHHNSVGAAAAAAAAAAATAGTSGGYPHYSVTTPPSHHHAVQAGFLPPLHHHHHHPYMHSLMGSKLVHGAHAMLGPGAAAAAHAGHHYSSGGGGGKRFRTKFTMEQREKMFEFSEKVGWRIQKQDEAAVQQFCADTGVKRHVLKVWMHNNKNTFGKKLLRFPEAFNAVPESSS